MKYVVQSTLFTIALLLVAWLNPSHSEINIGRIFCSWLTIMMLVNGPFVMSWSYSDLDIGRGRCKANIVDLANNGDIINLKIDYQNNGFYEEVITYSDICYSLDPKGERTNVIEPEHKMDAEELEVRNR